MQLDPEKYPQLVRETKDFLRRQLGDYRKVFGELEEYMKIEIAKIRSLESAAIPCFHYQDLSENGFNKEQAEQVRAAGCAVVRDTLPDEEVAAHYQQLVKYITENGYYQHKPKVVDKYFSQLEASTPQIFGIYWSQAQIWARQHPHMAVLRRHLNHLWIWQDGGKIFFNPDQEVAYADRVRRRNPGDKTLGLSPHVDSGSVERWLEEHYHHVYQKLFSTNWRNYQAFHGAHRVEVEEIPSPAVCSAFRTFQGWVGLTPQGRSDGTLQLVPSCWAVPYMLLRALQDDVPAEELCGALPGRAMVINQQYHSVLLEGLVSIPSLKPGDTVWWHPDTVHAVEKEHQGKLHSSVLFIGAAPDCRKNQIFAAKQREAFLNGKSSPDFAAEDHEVNYQGRATLADLTELGRKQMGFASQQVMS